MRPAAPPAGERFFEAVTAGRGWSGSNSGIWSPERRTGISFWTVNRGGKKHNENYTEQSGTG